MQEKNEKTMEIIEFIYQSTVVARCDATHIRTHKYAHIKSAKYAGRKMYSKHNENPNENIFHM